jgi:hypothetical protein
MPSGVGGLCPVELRPYSPMPTFLWKSRKTSALQEAKHMKHGEQSSRDVVSAVVVMRTLVHILETKVKRLFDF